jgi:hypothetical protein
MAPRSSAPSATIRPAFRHNRRKTNGVGRIAARVIEQLVARQPLPMRSLIDHTRRCRWFQKPELTA